MSARRRPSMSITVRMLLMVVVLLLVFTLLLSLLYNALMRRETIRHYSQTMQRNAYAIAQNLSELIVPTGYDTLDETRFIVSEDTLAPYMAFIEQLTNCDVYIVDTAHNVTGYFSGVVQQLDNPQLPSYLEQSIALGFMGKTPFIRARVDDETHLTSCMPVMNAHSQVLGVVLLESTLRELGYAQVPSVTVLATSCLIAFVSSVLLGFFLAHILTRPIAKLQRAAVSLAAGEYATRTNVTQQDEIGQLASTMDLLAERLEEARHHDEQLRLQQQAFFSSISHELKTPVTVIRGSLEALSDGVITSDQDVRAYYSQMIAESRWLQRLIQDLLELSRLQNLGFSLEMERVNLRDLLGDVAMSAHSLCERKGVRLICEEPSVTYVVEGDYTRLRQMLIAVVDNAVRFTPAGKGIRLSLSEDTPVITVEDEGVGIAQSDLPHIFDRYYHTRDASRQSTGLGLAIVQEIARRHDIAIDVVSQPGQGTRFTFAFRHLCG